MPPSQLTAKIHEQKQQQHTGKPPESQTHKQTQFAEMKEEEDEKIESKNAQKHPSSTRQQANSNQLKRSKGNSIQNLLNISFSIEMKHIKPKDHNICIVSLISRHSSVASLLIFIGICLACLFERTVLATYMHKFIFLFTSIYFNFSEANNKQIIQILRYLEFFLLSLDFFQSLFVVYIPLFGLCVKNKINLDLYREQLLAVGIIIIVNRADFSVSFETNDSEIVNEYTKCPYSSFLLDPNCRRR